MLWINYNVLIRLVLNKRILFLSFVLIALFNNNVFGQKVVRLDTIENIVYLGNFKLKTPSLFKSKYTYDPISNKYIYQTTVGEIDVGIPLVLTPKQYRKRIREENIKNYFTEKIDLLKDEDAEDVSTIQSVKGIGLKTAQRVIIELKDKVSLINEGSGFSVDFANSKREESLSALEVLGYSRKQTTKVVDKLISEVSEISVEEIIKNALNKL